jgi:hypothetical protein
MAANRAAGDGPRRLTMQYLLLIYGDEASYGAMSESESQAEHKEWMEYTQALKDSGAFKGGEALEPVATATSVRRNGGDQPLVSDGPFAETKEQLGGYYVLDVPDLDAAIKAASMCPGLKHGTIELRPIRVMPDA